MARKTSKRKEDDSSSEEAEKKEEEVKKDQKKDDEIKRILEEERAKVYAERARKSRETRARHKAMAGDKGKAPKNYKFNIGQCYKIDDLKELGIKLIQNNDSFTFAKM